jgi:hypothetical protein
MVITTTLIITQCAAAANHPVAGIYDWDRIAGTGGPVALGACSLPAMAANSP